MSNVNIKPVKIKMRVNPRVRYVSFAVSALIMAGVSLILLLFTLMFPIGSFGDFFSLIGNSGPLVILINLFPILAAMFFIFYLTNSLSFAACLVSLLTIVINIVNHYKILYRHEPLMPWDFLLISEFVGIIRSIDTKILVLAVIGISASIYGMIKLTIYVRTQSLWITHRLIMILVIILAAFGFNMLIYRSDKINSDLYVDGNYYDSVARVNSHGFLYSFLYNMNMSGIEHRTAAGREQIEKLIEVWKPEQPADQVLPHVIMIMGEAFSEIGDTYDINYLGYLDPLKQFKQLKNESVSGQIVVPKIGGGTSDTEFDVLTGMATRHFGNVPYAFSLIGRPVNGLVSLFNSLGYESVAIHPGQPWFYNREIVYEYLGFGETYFIDSFDTVSNMKGMYISEEATFSVLTNTFKEHLESSDKPLFEFCVTIQNHGPFQTNYKAEQNFNTTLDISQNEIISLSNYFEGLADADFQLNALVEYLRDLSEPVVLMYFGDHLPGFSDNIYQQLIPHSYSQTVELTRLNRVPYLIWQNDAAKELNEFDPEKVEFYNNRIMSSNFLGMTLLDLMGLIRADSYFDYVRHMVFPRYPVIFDVWYINVDDQALSDRGKNVKALETMKDWEYYRLFYENANYIKP